MKMYEILSEGAYDDGVSDGMRGKENPRASSIYGPSIDSYDQGFSAGLKKAKKENPHGDKNQHSPVDDAPAQIKSLDNKELLRLKKDWQAKLDKLSNLIQNDKYREERQKYKKDYKRLSHKLQMIKDQVKKRGLEESASAGASSAGDMAAVANPPSKKKKKSQYNPDGTVKNALDIDDNVMGSKTIKR